MLPPQIGISIRPSSRIKSENSSIAGEKLALNLLQGKRVTLKSPPMHQGKSHQLIKPVNSSHSNPRSTFLVINISEFTSHREVTHIHFDFLHKLRTVLLKICSNLVLLTMSTFHDLRRFLIRICLSTSCNPLKFQ
jgi:hypothetical protein